MANKILQCNSKTEEESLNIIFYGRINLIKSPNL